MNYIKKLTIILIYRVDYLFVRRYWTH